MGQTGCGNSRQQNFTTAADGSSAYSQSQKDHMAEIICARTGPKAKQREEQT